VPLSDAARALLRGIRQPAAPAPEPDPVPEPVPAAGPDPIDPEPDPVPKGRGGFRERAKREEERFRLATDSEYWIMLCFRHPDTPTTFARAIGLNPGARRLSGRAFAEATAHVQADTSRAARTKQMLTARSTRGADVTTQLAAKPVADPLGRAAAATGDLEADSAAEFTAMLNALTAAPDPNPPSIYDSPHWLLVCWPDRDAKDAYLNGSGLEVLGDKYLDGYQAARILGVDLPKEG
jgi:hypothetical protein